MTRRARPVRSLLATPLALAAIALAACATAPGLTLTPEELRSELRRRLGEVEPDDLIVPYEVDEASVALAREKLVGVIDPTERARALARLLRSPEGFGLRYEWASTETAEETLRRGGGNCMSLSSVLVGVARGLGLTAHYLEVTLAQPIRRDDVGVSVYVDHVAAVIVTPEGRLYIDYSGELSYARSVRIMGDLEAVSFYYNNRGYELMHRAGLEHTEIPWERAAYHFELATRVQPDLARAWNNQGVARARLGDDARARSAYERALEIQPDLRSAHLNLAILLLRTGDAKAAMAHFEIARRLDPDHPAVRVLEETLAPGNGDASAPSG